MLRLWAVAQRIGSVMTDQSAKIEIEVPPSDYTGPSIIFWTLHKAGSRYFYSVVKKLARSAGAPMLNIAAEYFQAGEKIELTPEAITYLQPTGYAYGPFRQPNEAEAIPDYDAYKRFLVVRDPRDILTSFYFSARFSHRKPGQGADEERAENTDMPPIEEYVLKQGRKMLPRWQTYADMIRRDPDLRLFKYEFIIDNFEEWMNQVVDHTGLPAKPAMVKALADAHVADVQEEEVTKHRRQIRPGDHKRKLEQSTIDELNALYGDIIELFGYEK